MRGWVLASALAAGLAGQEEARPTNPPEGGPAEARAFVGLEAVPTSCYVGQILTLHLRVGIDARFFAEHGLQLFHRHLDVPVQVEVAWPAEPAALPLDDTDPAPSQGLSLALGDAVLMATRTADEVRDGRTFTVVTVVRRFLPARAGDLALALAPREGAARLRFAYTTRFEDDFVQGRVGVDRHEVTVESRPLTLRILPLPEAGRPADFSGAVGQFTVRAETSAQRVDAGASFPLTLHIEGVGNLHAFAPPPLRLQGFHALGSIDTKIRGRRTITYDVSPLQASTAGVPGITFTFFDPAPPASYRTVTTTPLPLVVNATAGGPTPKDLSPRLTPGVDDVFAVRSVRRGLSAATGASSPMLLLALLGPWGLALGLVLWRRASARRLHDPAGRRARAAAASFHACLATPDADLTAAFTEFVAARLRCAPAAVISPDLPARLAANGVPPSLRASTAAALDALVASRYGSVATHDAAAIAALVDELERAFAESERGA